jgi:hypothetical protein
VERKKGDSESYMCVRLFGGSGINFILNEVYKGAPTRYHKKAKDARKEAIYE